MEPHAEQKGRFGGPAVWAGGAAALVGLLFGVRYYLYASSHESTDDAFIEGHVVPVSARVAGHVSEVKISDNQIVRQDDPLFELDPADFRVALDKAKAEVRIALAEAAQAEADASRYRTLFGRQEVSRQQLDHAATGAQTAEARVERAKAAAEQAELDLSYTRVNAPMAGRVTKKAVEPGQYVQAGQPVLALVSGDVWVVANFKETQLSRMRPGQKADIYMDAFPGRVFHGHVDSIQAGSGARFSLLPPENATGNYVKVIQRVPVKIVFDDSLNDGLLLGPGMSVEPEVEVR